MSKWGANSRGRYLLETLGLVLLAPAVLFYTGWALVYLGMSTPFRPWAQPETWVPGIVPPFPWVDCLSYLLGLVMVPLVWERAAAWHERQSMGFQVPGGPRPVLTLLLAVAGLLVYQRLAFWCLGQRFPSLLALDNLAYFIGLWTCVAFSEEFFLRSILQRRLTRLCGHTAAIVIVAVVFAFALHYQAPLVENALVRLPVGLALGWLFARQESLVSPVLTHFILNLAAFA